MKWAKLALCLFDLLETLFKHNVMALAHDALSFYGANMDVVNVQLGQGNAHELVCFPRSSRI